MNSTPLTPCPPAGFFFIFVLTDEEEIIAEIITVMKKCTLLLICFLIFLAACSPAATPEAADSPISFQDGLDRTVTLDAPARTIISLAPSNTEILFALNAGSQIAARDDYSNYPSQALELPSIGDTMGSISLEKIISLQPDLVLASPLTAPEQVKSMEDLGLKVFVLQNPADFEDLYQNLETVGKLTGHEKDASVLINTLRGRVKAVEEKLSGLTKKPLVFYELDGSEPVKPWTAGPGTFVDYLIGKAGGVNLGSDLSAEWVQISQEALIIKNPDFILLGDSLYGGVTADQVALRPGWDQIKAVKIHQVFPFNDDLVSRPGPRMVDGFEELAKVLHPDRF